MKKITILFWLLMALGYHAIGQTSYKVTFGYDDAGNRTKVIVIKLNDVIGEEKSDTIENSDDNNSQIINETNGISDNIFDQQFTIYPNPTRGVVYYKTTAQVDQNGTVIITDANGRILENTQLKANGTLDFSKYSGGIYFVRVTLKGDTSYWKIIKE